MSEVRKSFKWSALERIATQIIQLLLLIILARLLDPQSFGLIAMTTVVIAISNSFVDSGFSNALIRKGKPKNSEYSTVFYFNIVISLMVYALVYFLSDFVANFYDEQLLCPILKVLALTLVINSLTLVHRVKATVELQFKLQAKISLLSAFMGGVIGIGMAVLDYRVWALVGQALTISVSTSILFVKYVKFRPDKIFSFSEFKDMFLYGSRLLISSLLEITYANSFFIIIGKLFSSEQLGLYFQANRLIELPTNTFISIIQRVNLPVMSQADNDSKVVEIFYQTLSLSMFIFMPLSCFVIILSYPLFYFILGDAWVGSSKYLSILACGFMLYPIHVLNLNLLQVKKRSDLYLRLEVIKKTIGILIFFISYRYNIEGICIGIVITSYISLYVNSIYTKKIMKISFVNQVGSLSDVILVNGSALLLAAFWLISHDEPLSSSCVSFLIFIGCWFLFYSLFFREKLSLHKKILIGNK